MTDADAADGFGAKGWILVAAVVGAVLVVPGAVYLLPALSTGTELPFLVAMLVLPMLPAVVLGGVAVWALAGTARRESDDPGQEL